MPLDEVIKMKVRWCPRMQALDCGIWGNCWASILSGLRSSLRITEMKSKCDSVKPELNNSKSSYKTTTTANNWYRMRLTTVAPSPRRALRANSGTGSQEGRPKMAPSRSHISAIRTGLGAVPLITPAILQVVRKTTNNFHPSLLNETRPLLTISDNVFLVVFNRRPAPPWRQVGVLASL